MKDMFANALKSIKKFYADQRGTAVEDYANILTTMALSFALICVLLYCIQFTVIDRLTHEIIQNLSRMAAGI